MPEKKEGHLYLAIVALAVLSWWLAAEVVEHSTENRCWRDWHQKGHQPLDGACHSD